MKGKFKFTATGTGGEEDVNQFTVEGKLTATGTEGEEVGDQFMVEGKLTATGTTLPFVTSLPAYTEYHSTVGKSQLSNVDSPLMQRKKRVLRTPMSRGNACVEWWAVERSG